MIARSFSAKPAFMKSPEIIIKGSMEGRRVLNQSMRPDLAHATAVLGKKRRKSKKQEKDRQKKIRFIENVLQTFIKNI